MDEHVKPLEFTNTSIVDRNTGQVSSASSRWRRVPSLSVNTSSISGCENRVMW